MTGKAKDKAHRFESREVRIIPPKPPVPVSLPSYQAFLDGLKGCDDENTSACQQKILQLTQENSELKARLRKLEYSLGIAEFCHEAAARKVLELTALSQAGILVNAKRQPQAANIQVYPATPPVPLPAPIRFSRYVGPQGESVMDDSSVGTNASKPKAK